MTNEKQYHKGKQVGYASLATAALVSGMGTAPIVLAKEIGDNERTEQVVGADKETGTAKTAQAPAAVVVEQTATVASNKQADGTTEVGITEKQVATTAEQVAPGATDSPEAKPGTEKTEAPTADDTLVVKTNDNESKAQKTLTAPSEIAKANNNQKAATAPTYQFIRGVWMPLAGAEKYNYSTKRNGMLILNVPGSPQQVIPYEVYAGDQIMLPIIEGMVPRIVSGNPIQFNVYTLASLPSGTVMVSYEHNATVNVNAQAYFNGNYLSGVAPQSATSGELIVVADIPGFRATKVYASPTGKYGTTNGYTSSTSPTEPNPTTSTARIDYYQIKHGTIEIRDNDTGELIADGYTYEASNADGMTAPVIPGYRLVTADTVLYWMSNTLQINTITTADTEENLVLYYAKINDPEIDVSAQMGGLWDWNYLTGEWRDISGEADDEAVPGDDETAVDDDNPVTDTPPVDTVTPPTNQINEPDKPASPEHPTDDVTSTGDAGENVSEPETGTVISSSNDQNVAGTVLPSDDSLAATGIRTNTPAGTATGKPASIGVTPNQADETNLPSTGGKKPNSQSTNNEPAPNKQPQTPADSQLKQNEKLPQTGITAKPNYYLVAAGIALGLAGIAAFAFGKRRKRG